MNDRDEFLGLVDGYLDGGLEPERLAALDRRLRSDAQACRLFWAILNHEILVRQQSPVMPAAKPPVAAMAQPSPHTTTRSRAWWRQPRYVLSAAAALLVVVLSVGLWRGNQVVGGAIADVVAVSAPSGVIGEQVSAGAVSEPLRLGSMVRLGDRMLVANGATIDVRLRGEDTVLTLGSTSVSLFSAAPDGLHLQLASGHVAATVAHQTEGRHFTVTTPETIVTVIGTRFTVTATPERTAVEVDAGRVRVTTTDAPADASTPAVREIGPGERALAIAGRGLSISDGAPQRWDDRRPLGVMMLCRGTSGWATNPRGWFGDAKVDTTTPAGRVAFARRLDTVIDTTITNLQAMGAQGVVFWDIEGAEFAPGYIGDPRLLPQLAPEMDALVDRMMARLRAAGVAVGVTIRTEAIARSATGGLTLTRLPDPVPEVQARIAYARKRWGATIFPLLGDSGSALTMTAVCRRLYASEPGILLIPTGAEADTYRWGAPWWNPVQSATGITAQQARQSMPGSFNVIAPLERDYLEQHHAELVTWVRAGDVLTFRAWSRNAEHQTIRSIYDEAKP